MEEKGRAPTKGALPFLSPFHLDLVRSESQMTRMEDDADTPLAGRRPDAGPNVADEPCEGGDPRRPADRSLWVEESPPASLEQGGKDPLPPLVKGGLRGDFLVWNGHPRDDRPLHLEYSIVDDSQVVCERDGGSMSEDQRGLPTWLGRLLSIVCLVPLFGVLLFARSRGLLVGLSFLVIPALLLTLLYALMRRDRGGSE